MPFASCMSTHPDPAAAVGEAAGGILDSLGDSPDVTFAFVSDSHIGSMAMIHAAIRSILGGSLIGATSNTAIGGSFEAEGQPAVALWAGQLEDATPVRLAGTSAQIGADIDALLADLSVDPSGAADLTLILLADPYSFPVDAALDAVGASCPGLNVMGGLVSPETGQGGTAFMCDDGLYEDGAVGLLVGQSQVRSVVSQGCRPIGLPMTVTASEANRIDELAGATPMSHIERLFGSVSDEQKIAMNEGLHLGVVVDEHLSSFGPGDFLIRGVLRADDVTGAIVLSEGVAIGETVQFQIRDAPSASGDLHLALSGIDDAGAAIAFIGGERGSDLFNRPSHDAETIHDRLGVDTIAGMYCAGEIGRVGARSFVHGFSSCIAVFS